MSLLCTICVTLLLHHHIFHFALVRIKWWTVWIIHLKNICVTAAWLICPILKASSNVFEKCWLLFSDNKKKTQRGEVASSWPDLSQDSLHACNESQRHWQGGWGLQCYMLDFSSLQHIIVELLQPRALNLRFLWGKVTCCQSSRRQESRFATQQ